jgi:hypothetical protein
MPCGGGDIGLNAWLENGDILLYIALSGTLDENNSMLKLGRVRITCEPNPFNGAVFRQELNLETGSITISGQNGSHMKQVHMWVDVFSPVIHVQAESSEAIAIEAIYENWRFADRVLHNEESFGNPYKWALPDGLKAKKDAIGFQDNAAVFYHRNAGETVFDVPVRQQGMEAVKHEMSDPLKNLTFGGQFVGDSLDPTGTTAGEYWSSSHQGWRLKSESPAKKQSCALHLHTRQYADQADWASALAALIADNKKRRELPAVKPQIGGKTAGSVALFISTRRIKMKTNLNGRWDEISSFSGVCWDVVRTTIIQRDSKVDCLLVIHNSLILVVRLLLISETGEAAPSLPKTNGWFIFRCSSQAILIC